MTPTVEGPNHERARKRLLAKIVKGQPGECWAWTAGRSRHTGYGTFHLDGHNVSAHRAAYILLVGPVAGGLEVDHLCRNRACVNPEHLEPVTSSENKLRSPLVGRAWQRAGSAAAVAQRLSATTCRNGHSRAEHGFVRDGHADCRECRRATVRRYKSRKQVA